MPPRAEAKLCPGAREYATIVYYAVWVELLGDALTVLLVGKTEKAHSWWTGIPPGRSRTPSGYRFFSAR